MSRADTVGIVGAGPFGTALASVLARHGRRTILWSRDTDVVESIRTKRVCPRFPSAPLPEPLEATADPKRLAAEARFIVLAVVSANARDRARELGNVLDGSHIVVHAIGALTPDGNRRVSEVMADGLPTLKIGALAGPALPKDLAGAELASALAGAYTVALGLADGLHISAGPRAVLITRAVAEASRLGVASGAEAKTFSGLAGLGNLLVRASGDRSADYVLGRRLAEGIVTADAARTEGARAALASVELAAKLKVRMPVLQGITLVLSGKAEPREAAQIIGDTVAEEE